MQTLKILSRQSGVFRVSCLDCLNRTHSFLQALAIKTL
jgi:ribosomal protein S27E